ncbi:MAG: hypothetical protein KJ950_01375 [Proteobacteria bacterium]|nr:hypothetical protein [Pseudomonadota bacterium]MBU1686307.1 hypothetical protein [Pseudomonadota bacterium]
MKALKNGLLILAAITLLAGCGGGGSSSLPGESGGEANNTTDPGGTSNTNDLIDMPPLTALEIDEIDISHYTQVFSDKLHLVYGWNLAALPVDITLSELEYSMYFEDYSDIYTFDGSLCSDFDPNLASWDTYDVQYIENMLNSSSCWQKNPQEIRAGEGFWIWSNTEQDVPSFAGSPYGIDEKNDQLNEGWHLLGSGTMTAVSSFCSFTDTVWTYNALESSWSKDSVTVQGGQGFWFYKGPPASKRITTMSSTERVFSVQSKADSLKLNSGDCTTDSEENLICTPQTLDEAQAYINKPMFVGDSFKGVVQAVTGQNGNITYQLASALTVDDVFDNFDIEMGADEVVENVSRAVSRFTGKYDSINPEPLKFSIITVDVAAQGSTTASLSGSRTDQVKELVLRVNFPKGYTIPLQSRGLNCDFSEASCDGSFQGVSADSENDGNFGDFGRDM